MVKNLSSSSNLHGSTSTSSLLPSQADAPAAAPPVAVMVSRSPTTQPPPSSLAPLEDEDDSEIASTNVSSAPNTEGMENVRRRSAWDSTRNVTPTSSSTPSPPKQEEEKGKEVTEQEIEQVLKYDQELSIALAEVNEAAARRRRVRAFLEERNNPTYLQRVSSQHEDPETEMEQAVEGYTGTIGSRFHQPPDSLGLSLGDKPASKSNEYPPQSTLFSKFDTSFNSKQKEDSRLGRGTSKPQHAGASVTPLFKVASHSGFADPPPTDSITSLYEGFTREGLISKLVERASKELASVPQPSRYVQFDDQIPVDESRKKMTDAERKNLLRREAVHWQGGMQARMKETYELKNAKAYTKPFCEFLTENPTVWHAVQYFEKKLDAAGFKKLSERQTWNATLEKGGKYYVSRNGSSLIAFTVGANYKSGNGVAIVAGHVDALTARLKPVSTKSNNAGYVQLGVAPYAGALNSTWWDRDLGIGGRVLVEDGTSGKIETKLVKLGWPIARIPTLAPHFGVGMTGSNNTETEAVPIIGLDYSSPSASSEFENLTLGGAGSFAATQPPKLVRAIAGELSIQDYSSIFNWELELYDTQPAQVGGLEKEFIFAGRIDDKLCSWAAIEGLLASAASSTSDDEDDDGIVKLVGVFDDEEIGSLLRQGARGNFLPSTIERIAESFGSSSSANILSQTYANSFLVSADVTHAVNPNFLSRYLENHAPRLNVGLVVSADSNGHMTTDAVSTALLTRIAEKSGSELQLFMIRNDSRSGGTVGPMLSAALGVRAIDAGIPQLSMHSIRATTGALDPGLGVQIFKGFFDHFESVDKEFE